MVKPFGLVTTWVLAARPRTLPASIAPVIVGTALAFNKTQFSPKVALACLLLSLLLQIASNFANDLIDYKRGTDKIDRVGPKRAVATGMVTTRQMEVAVLLCLLLSAAIGSYLALIGGWVFFAIGAFCLAGAVLYTAGPFAFAYNGLGDLAVFIFFGLVAVIGTFYLQAGYVSPASVIAAVGVGALVANILVVNNTRDRHTDAGFNKKTLAVRYGKGFCIKQYAFLLIVAYAAVFALLAESHFAFLPLLSVPIALKAFKELRTLEGKQLNATLGKTANLLLLYSALLAAGIVL